MDKEVLELLKTISGSTETLLIWYMIIDVIKHITSCIAWIIAFWMLGKGARKFQEYLDD